MPNGKAPIRTAVLLFFAVFALYLFCAYPCLAPRDSADLALAALSLSAAHPPGYPLYAVLGKAWILLFDLGNPAYRLNVLSGLFGAAAAAILFLFLRRRSGITASLGAAGALAVSAFLWKFSLLEEMYSLHALMIVFLLFLSEGRPQTFLRRASLSGLIFGLGLVNHQSLVLFFPALLIPWCLRARQSGIEIMRPFIFAFGFFLIGFSLEAFLWIRLHDPWLAWRVLARTSYGSVTLFKPFTINLDRVAIWRLLSDLTRGLLRGYGWPAAIFGLLGLARLWEKDRPLFWGMTAGFLAFGPVYFLATRLTMSEWVSRSILEPDFIAPGVFLCAFSAFGLDWLENKAGIFIWLAAAFTTFWPLAANAAGRFHREDFSAYDYVYDLRRSLPPHSTLVVGGDTALFGMRYFENLKPKDEILLSSAEPGLRDEISQTTARKQSYATGLSENALSRRGLLGNPLYPIPDGLCQKISTVPPETRAFSTGPGGNFWDFSMVRMPGENSRDSYARDIKLCYGFAHYLSGKILERFGWGDPSPEYLAAFAADPDEYKIVLSSGKSL
ncbi:MAG: protein O-mannosyl-transferase family [Elusimicrobiota bacterium]